jgi:hypothetical protein
LIKYLKRIVLNLQRLTPDKDKIGNKNKIDMVVNNQLVCWKLDGLDIFFFLNKVQLKKAIQANKARKLF